MKIPRYAVVIIVAALALAGLAFALRPRALSVTTQRVSFGPLAQTVEAEAKTRVKERYVVAAPVSGRALRLLWKEGDSVQSGALVARIDPLPANAAVQQALAQIQSLREEQSGIETLKPKAEAIAQGQARTASARASYEAARERVVAAQASYEQALRDEQRVAKLEASGYLPSAQLESARLARNAAQQSLRAAQRTADAAAAEVRAAQAAVAEIEAKRSDPEYLRGVYGAQIAAIEAQLRALEDQAARTSVRAPVTGVVLRVPQRSEQYVTAGTPLLEIGDRRSLEIVADVLSPDAVSMRPGNTVTVVRGAGEQHPRARVRLVEPAGYTKVSALGIEEQRVNVIADFVDPPGALGDQYRLDVQIATWSAPHVLRVPLAALFRCEAQWCAFVVDANVVRRRVVRTGHQGDEFVEVLSGVRDGEAVVLHPSDQIRDGSRVEVAAR